MVIPDRCGVGYWFLVVAAFIFWVVVVCVFHLRFFLLVSALFFSAGGLPVGRFIFWFVVLVFVNLGLLVLAGDLYFFCWWPCLFFFV